ncbi:hypothetical protein A2Y83_01825 [Candidatus Falkowbacteria bacterium RBG_13_39_14]|uniref:Four helix bundle protein n=1 Tax=Candidatus Falkowbacteria bacterium RBG_13_39_14 TaxID=1797985 RepID=A0A1F5S3A4_9BACT|nr:MAG: hypothetical protein A2Y83_01825 [Candidatus Falkowbacteria bacterium RBG_13_39_14]
MGNKYLQLNDINAYKVSFSLSNHVWDVVLEWDILAKRTIGEQFIRAVDSISANIAEGFGRFNKKDKIRFYYIARASVFESLDWNEKAKNRNLLKKDQYDYILGQLKNLPKEINHLIGYTNKNLSI